MPIVRAAKPTKSETGNKPKVEFISLKDDGQFVYFILVSDNLDNLDPNNNWCVSYNKFGGKVASRHIATYGDSSSGKLPSDWFFLPEVESDEGITPYQWMVQNRNNKQLDGFFTNQATKSGYSAGNIRTEYLLTVLWDGKVYEKGKSSVKSSDLKLDKLAVLSMNERTFTSLVDNVNSYLSFATVPNPSIVGQLMSMTRNGVPKSPQTSYNVQVHPVTLPKTQYDMTVIPPDYDIAKNVYGATMQSQLYKMRDLGFPKWAEDNGIDNPFDFSLIEKKDNVDPDDIAF